MNVECKQIERMLSELAPSQVPGELLERIESEAAAGRFGSEPADVGAKVVPFPAESRRVMRVPAPKFNWTRLAVAAVAVLGAVIAWVMPEFNEHKATTGGGTVPAAARFTPDLARSGVRDVYDEGVVWTGGQPLRKVRVIYCDRMILRNARGEQMEVEVPRTEFVLVPERVD